MEIDEQKIKMLARILVKWNALEIKPNNACLDIWNLFMDDIALPEWNREMKYRKELRKLKQKYMIPDE